MVGIPRSLVLNEDYTRGGGLACSHEHWKSLPASLKVLEHKDSTGGSSQIHHGRPGCVGTGIRHSEMNASLMSGHLFQIWVQPNRHDVEPGYADHLPQVTQAADQSLIASHDGRDDSLQIFADADLYGGTLAAGNNRRQFTNLNMPGFSWLVAQLLLTATRSSQVMAAAAMVELTIEVG